MARVCACGTALRWSARTCDPCKAAHEAAYRARRSAGNVSPALRAAVIERDGYVCRHCLRPVRPRRCRGDIERDTLEIDHVVPLLCGGETTLDNLVVSCMGCNRAKGGRAA